MGTSSWKYPGWQGQIYTPENYTRRGRFSETRFNDTCLAEYSTVFPTVCVDAAYYKFPDARYVESLLRHVPEGFRFALKVTDEITVKRFPKLDRFGSRAGQANPNFLNPRLFAEAFLSPLRPHREFVGLVVFEFSRFYPSDFERGRDFVAALDGFLREIPRGWAYGVEIRNAAFLQPAYFHALHENGVAHVFNSWAAMPPVSEQVALAGPPSRTQLVAARFLLRPGRGYEAAVSQFSPYERIQDPYLEGRSAAAGLIRQGRQLAGRARTFVYVNNRFEGNAPQSIAAMLEEAGLP